MRMSTKRSGFSRRRTRRKTSFPLVVEIQKRPKPRQLRNLVSTISQTDTKRDSMSGPKQISRPVKKSRATIDYKNVILLRKLITAEGKILPRRINKNRAKQQRFSAKAIKSARIMGLLPFINKSRS